MSNVTIRPIEHKDRAAWTPLWQGYLAFYETVLPEAAFDAAFKRLTAGDPGMGGFIAERDGKAVGIVHWLLHPTYWSDKDLCYLQDLFTAPEARGTGAARALIEAVHKVAAERNCLRVYWLTHESNAQARVLYDKVATNSGFIVYRQPIG